MELTEIKFQDAATGVYLGSPSLVRMDNDDLLAVHDYFGPQSTEYERALSTVYRSSDGGASWTQVTHIVGSFWAGLFVHRGALHLLGTSRHIGSIVIRRSEDNGNTWTMPRCEKSGVLFRGGPCNQAPNYHCAPMPVLLKDGRLYRAFEDNATDTWGPGFLSAVISAPEDADLIDAASWTMSNKLAYDPARTPSEWGETVAAGWLEGNVVETPEGELWNILRFNSNPGVDKAAVVKIHDEGRRVSFDPATGFLDFPGGMTKFTIRRDPETGTYWTISNNNTDPAYPQQRNVLSLHASDDLVTWRHVQTLLEDDLGLPWEESVRFTAFQYIDWQFDGEDIIYISRTAYDGAANFHDANRVTFHRVEGFKKLG